MHLIARRVLFLALVPLTSALGLAQDAAEYPSSQLLLGEMRYLLQVESFDLDGDGVADLVGYSDAFDALLWQRGNGSAPLGPERFGPPQTLLDLPELETSAFQMRLFEVADMTGDGLSDLVIANLPAQAI
ncbi:MAG: VCBS repeat-containing protein [Planctomycetota bacterium]